MLKISNVTYDRLKWIAQVLLPALGTLYVALGAIWSFDFVQQVSGSILALDTFLGVILGISNAAYKNSDDAFDGTMDVHQADGKKTFTLSLNGDPEELEKNSSVTFKVNTPAA